MNGRRLLTLSALAFLFACEDQKTPTGPTGLTPPMDPSAIISDGAHGGNPDFFFLPPMVPFPRNAEFELGKFNNTLKPSLKIEICELKAQNLNGQGLPTATTPCVAGAPLKTFAPGSVQLVNLPLRQFGWWSLFGLPADGFYYVLWDTRQSNLDVNKYYRITVLINGSTVPLGIADVDPMSNLRQWKYTLTGDVVQLIDDILLPIPFRVEKGGGPVLCGTASLCNSVVVTNNSPTGSTIVTVDGGSGAVAGAKFPNGWLPAGGPQSVVVTIASVNTGVSNPATGTEATPCHAGLPLQQFRACFQFTTTPRLAPIDESGAQFAIPVTVAVCYVLQGTGDPREKFAELYASGPNEPPHALPDASDAGILAANSRDCSNSVIGLNNSKGVPGLASAGWQKLKGGLWSIFGVKTAYGVDIGLGGFLSEFSSVGPALSANIEPVSATQLTIANGGTVQPSVRIVGSNHHDGEHQNSTGLGGLPVTWVTSGGATVNLPGTEGGNATQVVGTTGEGGLAGLNWTVPSTPGTYTLTANGQVTNGPVTFTAIVPTPPPPPFNFINLGATERRMLSMQTGASIPIGVVGNSAVVSWSSSAGQKITVSAAGVVTAIVGGENIQGGDSSLITTVLSTGGAGPTLLANSFAFDIFPRTTTLVWNSVVGAVSYRVVTEYGNGSETNPFCTVPSQCGIWTDTGLGSTTTNQITFTFGFVGAQPGRWRVFALDDAGAVISTSPYVYFAYRI